MAQFSINILLKKKDLKLKLLTKRDTLQSNLVSNILHRPGLVFAGFAEDFPFKQLQIVGQTELNYIKQIKKERLKKSIDTFFQLGVPGIIVTKNLKPPIEFIHSANKYKIPVFSTSLHTFYIESKLGEFLDKLFAPQLSFHGSLVDVYGVGMLFAGCSGIGKSELVLDLVTRGHQFVADDIVRIIRTKEGHLIGESHDLLQQHVEIKGVGIINLQSLFGIRSILPRKKIEIEINLVYFNPQQNYERVGIEETTADILGVEIQKILLPVVPGKNLAVISEVVAMNYLLKMQGVNAASDFDKRMIAHMKKQERNKIR